MQAGKLVLTFYVHQFLLIHSPWMILKTLGFSGAAKSFKAGKSTWYLCLSMIILQLQPV